MYKKWVFLMAFVLLLGLLSAGSVAQMELKVDLAVPLWESDPTVPIAATAKPGWSIWAAGRWADMYMHDFVTLEDIDGSGVSAGITSAREGNAGLAVHGMCMGQVGGGVAPTGYPVGDPIANTWFYNVENAGNPRANLVLLLYGLPGGEYTLRSYHNFWLACSDAERKCTDCEPNMPPMPIIWPIGLADANDPELWIYGYGGLVGAAGDAIGNPGGVQMIESAYNVTCTSTLNDDEVATSEVQFRTNGSAVVVIYEAPEDWFDLRGRLGGRGVLNAFELMPADGPLICPCPGDLDANDQVDLQDLDALVNMLVAAGPPFIVLVEPGHCGDLAAPMEQVDLQDLDAMVNLLVSAGPPFIVPCE